MKSDTIALHIGPQAFSLLEEAEFQNKWDELQANCPWATVFQGRSFVTTWYKVYQNNCLPIVLTAVQDGQLTGLLTLAKQGKMIRSAGADQAEYSVWLSQEQNKDSFIHQALQLVLTHFPGHPIYLKYLPERTPLAWIQQPIWKQYCILKSFKQPLLKISPDWTAKKLKRRSRKNEIKRLNQFGALTFERIFDYEQFSALLDELITLYEFRKGAVYNTSQFQKEAQRKDFLLGLFKEDLLHVTVLKAGSSIVAASIYTIEGNCLYAKGLSTHAPEFANYSPGTLQKILLSKMLADEAFEVMDLTPGGELYKDDMATHYGEVYVLTVNSKFNSLNYTVRSKINQYLKGGIRQLAEKEEMSSSQWKKLRWQYLFVKDKLQTLRKQPLLTTVKLLAEQCTSLVKPKTQKYITTIGLTFDELTDISNVQKNSIRDLLSFDARGTLMSRWQFLRTAMRRLEDGETAYTWCKDGRLLGCVWLNPDKVINGDTVQLEGIYIHYSFRKRLAVFLKAVITKIKQENTNCKIVALTAYTNRLLHKTFMDIGFKRVG